MVPKIAPVLLFIALTACSRLEPLTPESLENAQTKWQASKPGQYRLVLEMEGDRVEAGRYEVNVSGEEVTLRRNGEVILLERPQDYSMAGWFRMLRQEIDLANNAQLLGAPEGYSSYPMAEFDADNGRLVRFQRSVGGTQNSIDITIVEFQAKDQASSP